MESFLDWFLFLIFRTAAVAELVSPSFSSFSSVRNSVEIIFKAERYIHHSLRKREGRTGVKTTVEAELPTSG